MMEKNGLCGMVQKMKMPYVKHKVSADVEMYASRSEKTPFAAMRVKDEQCYSLWCVVKILGAVMLISWSICKLRQLMKKIL